MTDDATLTDLARMIASRRGDSPDASYTAKLLHQGREKCAKKFGEEAVELALASMGSDAKHIAEEAADVLYHLLVVLEGAGVPLDDVYAELKRRKAQSGIAEKKSRGQGPG